MGWQEHTVPWQSLGQSAMEGGLQLCMPEGWAPIAEGNTTFSNGSLSLNVFLEVRLDHADALRRLSDTDSAHCTAEAYEWNVVRAGATPDQAWPALLQSYIEAPAACGACPDPMHTAEVHRVANVSIAFGEYLLQTRASAPEGIADADQIIAIGRTAHVPTQQTPSEAGSEVADLITQRSDRCP